MNEVRGQRQTLTSDDAIEVGMKTTDTQTELIDGSSPSSDDLPMEFKIVDEHSTENNNKQPQLNINSVKDLNGLRSIDDDASSGRRVLFTPDSPEAKL